MNDSAPHASRTRSARIRTPARWRSGSRSGVRASRR
jgi:hypothetical protein